jgi:hypothetical protein
MRTFKEVQLAHYREHPEDLGTYLNVSFEEFYEFKDIRILVRALTLISKVRRIEVEIAPEWDSVLSGLYTLGFKLVPQALDKAV